jgi:spermidine/putrescine transport system ATP-binding protein
MRSNQRVIDGPGGQIELVNLTKTYDRAPVLKGINLTIERGEFFSLLGPSGCGKTTTLRLIGGFESADVGEVRIDGVDMVDVPPENRPVNTVFQSYALFPHLTVFENVAYGLTLKRVPKTTIRSKVLEMLDRVSLVDKAASMPRQLSGGQMQRIALARALINEPKVLLLDEPLGSLDAKLRKAMQIELKHVHGRLGITFIYVTHDQEEALVMSDRIAVMSAGRIAQLGSPDDVFERPRDRFVAEFIGTANFLSGRIVEAASACRRIALDHGLVWTSTAPSDAAPGDKVTVALRPQKIRVMPQAAVQAAGPNFARAVLREIVYVGAWVRLVLELGPGAMLVVENTPDSLPFDYRSLRPGNELCLEVPPDAILLFRE